MEARRDVHDYVDGRLAPKRRKRFEARLASDAALAAEVAEAERVLALVRSLPVRTAPEPLLGNVMSAVRGEPVPTRRPWLLLRLGELAQPRRLVPVTAAALAAVSVALLARPERVELTPVEQRFVQECLVDYYSLMARDVAPQLDRLEAGTANVKLQF